MFLNFMVIKIEDLVHVTSSDLIREGTYKGKTILNMTTVGTFGEDERCDVATKHV